MIYRTICSQLWTDPKVSRLSVVDKLLFVYLITNPSTHLSGIYNLPSVTLIDQTGLTDRVSRVTLDTLSNLGLAYRDKERQVSWVVNMFRYQGQGPKNEQAAANQLLTLHQSPLCEQFLEHYPAVRQYLKKPGRVKRDSLAPSVRFFILQRDHFTCQYCGAPGTERRLEIDHRIPVVAGGTDDPENLTTACLACNQGKGSDTLSASCPSVPDPVLLTSSLNSPDSDPNLKSNGNTRDYRDEAKTLLAFLNEKSGKKFRANDVNLKFIEGRLKSGVDLQTCRTLIMRKVRDWLTDPKMTQYLRPETLFNQTKFETYLAEVTP